MALKWENFSEKLGSWAPKIKPFFDNGRFDPIYRRLKEIGGSGKTIVPRPHQTFRCFEHCPYSELKAVFILQDAYKNAIEGVPQADGIPMSCSNTGILQPSLEQWYTAIEDDVYGGLELNMEKRPDLAYLASQGVLLLNSSLTTNLGTTGVHLKEQLWHPFVEYILKLINEENLALPIVFIGKDAQEFSYLINPSRHHIFELEHPAYAARQNRNWKHENVFSKISDILYKTQKTSILWDLGPAPF
jgi:uracil-DNA glycosylase